MGKVESHYCRRGKSYQKKEAHRCGSLRFTSAPGSAQNLSASWFKEEVRVRVRVSVIRLLLVS